MTEHILLPPSTKRRPSGWALVLSAILNLLFALLLIWVNLKWQKEAEKMAAQQQQVQVELVPQPAPPPQPKAQQPKPEQKQAEQKPPEQKPPEQQKPQEKQPEQKPQKQPEKQERFQRPPPPQLRQAQIREKSSTDRKEAHNGANGENVAIALGHGPMISLRSEMDDTRGPEGSSGPIGQELSQSEQDFVLSQILPYWRVDTHRPEAHGLVLEAIIEINADGTLMAPLGKDDPWNPAGIIAGYADLVRLGYSYRREAMEGFLLALRLSQPLKVPPGGTWPKWMKLRFAFDDL